MSATALPLTVAPICNPAVRLSGWISDKEAFRFLDAKSGALEIGVADHPGVTVQAAYAIERTRDGSLALDLEPDDVSSSQFARRPCGLPFSSLAG